jgi:hypothetical protein
VKKSWILFIYFQLLFAGVGFSQPWPKTYPQWNGSNIDWLINYYDKGYMFLIEPQYLDNKYAIIVKTDINGNVLWDKYIGNGQYGLSSGDMEQTKDNGFVYAAGFSKYDPNGGSDPFMIKFNPCGEMQWCSVISTPGIFDYADRVRQTPEGDYVLLTSYSDPNPINRIQIYKFDSAGNLFWKHNYPGDNVIFDDDGYDLTVLSNGYLITGMCFSPDSGQTGGGYERPYYIRTDTAGNELWRLPYGRNNGFQGSTFATLSTISSNSGNFYDSGWHSNYCDTPALIKCMSVGTEGYYQDMIPGVCPGGTGGLNWLDDTTIIVTTGGILNDTLIAKWMKLDTMGVAKYSKFFQQSYILHSQDICTVVTFDKKITTMEDYNELIYFYRLNTNFDFDSIYTHQYIYDSLCPHQIVSDTIDPNCDLIVSIDNTKTLPQASKLKVYPNPAVNQISVEFPKVLVLSNGQVKNQGSKEYYQWKSTTLEVYDLEGKKVFEREIPKSQQQLEMDISNWNRGMYYFRLEYNNQMVAGEKIVVE